MSALKTFGCMLAAGTAVSESGTKQGLQIHTVPFCSRSQNKLAITDRLHVAQVLR